MICELAAVDVNAKHNIEERETATDDVLAGGPLQDFAFVAIDEHASVEGADSAYAAEVVSWARVDCIAAGVGDAGLFAVERRRSRGQRWTNRTRRSGISMQRLTRDGPVCAAWMRARNASVCVVCRSGQ